MTTQAGYLEYRVRDDRYRRANNGQQWFIRTALRKGRNVVFLRVVDAVSGRKSKTTRVVIIRV